MTINAWVKHISTEMFVSSHRIIVRANLIVSNQR